MYRRPRLIGFLAVTALVAACAAPPSLPPDVPGATASSASPTLPPGPNTVRDGAAGISFERPVGWSRWQPNDPDPLVGGPLIYLSTDPLRADCATRPGASPNPMNARGVTCTSLTSLSPDGVFVEWVAQRLLSRLPTSGEPIAMNGSTARPQIERPGSCRDIGADETISVLVPIGQPTPLSNIVVVACLRGPDLSLAEVQVRAMLTSAIVR
ncbi:MAG: hypothetical protein IVW53_10050 [Chloroflexi bacterium]|nr:hypothetical protein [Chloroflexota bacterium]